VKWLIPKILLGAGICLFGAGLLYGVFTVGVPTPDATPSVAAQEARDLRIADVIMTAGFAAFVIGLIWIAVSGIAQTFRRRTSSDS
jgi:hypothetical protein